MQWIRGGYKGFTISHGERYSQEILAFDTHLEQYNVTDMMSWKFQGQVLKQTDSFISFLSGRQPSYYREAKITLINDQSLCENGAMKRFQMPGYE